MDESLLSQIEPLLLKVARPVRYIGSEFGALSYTEEDIPSYRCALVYPDTYELGQSNQAIAILQDVLNATEGIYAERAFVPWKDMAALLREKDIPLFTLESVDALKNLDMIGITLPHELACTNILEFLDLARIPLRSADRDLSQPLIIAGGPCAYNPEPLAPFFDLFNIGEGEHLLPEIALRHKELLEQGLSKEEMLLDLAQMEGVYVPSLYEERGGAVVPVQEGIAPVVTKRVMQDFSTSLTCAQPIVPFAETTHDRLSIEVLRGCARGCRFCQAGMMYRPVRERSADMVMSAVMGGLACTGYDEVSLTSLSTTDHSQIEEILRRLNNRLENTGISVSIPSQRLDAFGVDMARLVAGNKKGGLTFAPEAGTQRMRDIINKKITEADLHSAVTAAFEAGWRRLKLYFMCGLPFETDDDLSSIGELVGKVSEWAREAVDVDQRGNVRIAVSCALFVPKPHTPFQWCGQISEYEFGRRIKIIRASMPKRGVDFHWHDIETSLLESVVARGGREVARLIEEAWRQGACFDAWSEEFNLEAWQAAASSLGIDLAAMASQEFDLDGWLPWDHISTGVSKTFLKEEYRKARSGVTTPDCTFTDCTGCGACQALGCNNVIGGVRNGTC